MIYNEDYVCNVLHGNHVKDVMLRNFEKFSSGKAFPGVDLEDIITNEELA